MILVIGGLFALWAGVCLVVLAACWAARRGDDSLTRDHPPDRGPRRPRARTPMGMARRPSHLG